MYFHILENTKMCVAVEVSRKYDKSTSCNLRIYCLSGYLWILILERYIPVIYDFLLCVPFGSSSWGNI